MAWQNVSKPTTSNYTNVAKPTGAVTIRAGFATGVIGPPTYSREYVIETKWIKVPKPT